MSATVEGQTTQVMYVILPGFTSIPTLTQPGEIICGTRPTLGMKAWIKDSIGLGLLLWLLGYLAGMVLFFSPLAGNMGWIITALFTPVTILVTWWWFHGQNLPLAYYAGVGIAWAVIAMVFDFLFIVCLFQAQYYALDIYLYYALMFLIPVGIGLYLNRVYNEPIGGQ